MKKLLVLPLLASFLLAENTNVAVKINKDISHVYTTDSGKKIKVERIQDTKNRLTDDYSKTSRPCPPFCIQPTKIDPEINNFEELELLNFMQHQVKEHTGVIIDARLKSWYELETIPSAVNIPFPIMQNASKEKAKRIFMLLGMTIDPDGKWNFSKAKELVIFCNGVGVSNQHTL